MWIIKAQMVFGMSPGNAPSGEPSCSPPCTATRATRHNTWRARAHLDLSRHMSPYRYVASLPRAAEHSYMQYSCSTRTGVHATIAIDSRVRRVLHAQEPEYPAASRECPTALHGPSIPAPWAIGPPSGNPEAKRPLVRGQSDSANAAPAGRRAHHQRRRSRRP